MKASAARFIGSLPVLLTLFALPCLAQDIEPRRWSHLAIGANFGGLGYAFITGDITFNPVLQIQDGHLADRLPTGQKNMQENE